MTLKQNDMKCENGDDMRKISRTLKFNFYVGLFRHANNLQAGLMLHLRPHICTIV